MGRSLHAEALQAAVSEGLAQGPYVAAKFTLLALGARLCKEVDDIRLCKAFGLPETLADATTLTLRYKLDYCNSLKYSVTI